MRKIKFRAWVPEIGMTPVYKLEFGSNGVRLVGGCRWLDGNHPQENTIPMESYLLMQYTGLKDKNGVEIYEGDVLRLSYDERDDPLATIHEVVYCADDDYPAFDLFPELGCEENGLSHAMACMWGEVIGNIYENPELLEVES